jgi:hypothetical protein
LRIQSRRRIRPLPRQHPGRAGFMATASRQIPWSNDPAANPAQTGPTADWVGSWGRPDVLQRQCAGISIPVPHYDPGTARFGC